MSKRSYQQYCPTAGALDVIGERWTLLLIRELQLGPRRFTDLQKGLPAMGPNLLSARLKTLEQAGVVQRRKLPPPAATTVYELTQAGIDLKGVLRELARWGLRYAYKPYCENDFTSAVSVMCILPNFFYAEMAFGLSLSCTIQLGDEVFSVQVHNGQLSVSQGETRQPDLQIGSDAPTFFQLIEGSLLVFEAVGEDKLQILAGDEETAVVFFNLFKQPVLE